MEPITEIDMLGVGDGRVRCRSTFEDGDGDLYGFYMWGPDHYGAWPTSNYGGRNRLTKWDANGNVRWSVGRHVAGRAGVNTDLNTEAPRGQLHDPSTIDGEVRDTIVVADRVEHTGMVYTKDGLYAGYLMEERADDGLPDRVYEWWWDLDADRSALLGHDCAQGGDIVEHDGEVYWFSPSSQGSVVYRIRGWDAWTRAETTVGIDDRPSHASGEGSGLAGAYHASADLSGPAAEQVDDRVWFGQTGEDTSNVLDGRPPATDWSKGVGPLDDPDAFGVRWTGEIEPELTEAYAFSTYARGGVRLWIGGEQVIHGWNESHWQREGPPVALVAGERYPVRLDYYTTSDRPAVSLNWEAFSRERERVPTAHLYPDAAVDPAAWQVGARDATARIPAESFDTTNVETPEFDTFSWKTCRCFLRGFDGEGTYLGYRRLDFGDGVSQFRTDMGGNADHEVAIRVDAPDGRTIGTGTTAGDGVTAIDVDTATGVHDCYLVTTAGGSGVRWFTFDA
jgi:hypothetical protein